MMKPILFNTAMVKALLDGRKTVTRRLLKPQPKLDRRFWQLGGAGWSDTIKSLTPVSYHSLYNRMPYKPGDVLYVRETFKEYTKRNYRGIELEKILGYKTDEDKFSNPSEFYQTTWKPSIHMPKSAARIFLKVTGVKLEKLQEITAEQCADEGINIEGMDYRFEAVSEFESLWNSTINKQDFEVLGWDANPWVWVIEFERCEKPEGER